MRRRALKAASLRRTRRNSSSAGYNHRRRVPEHPQHFADWGGVRRATIDALRRGSTCASVPSQGDARPVRSRPRPRAGTLAFFHGGYWRAFDKSITRSSRSRSWRRARGRGRQTTTVSRGVDRDDRSTSAAVQSRGSRRKGPATAAPAPIAASGHSAGGAIVAMLFRPTGGRTSPRGAARRRRQRFSRRARSRAARAVDDDADLSLDAAERAGCRRRTTRPPPRTLYVAAGAANVEFLRHRTLMFDACPGNRWAG